MLFAAYLPLTELLFLEAPLACAVLCSAVLGLPHARPGVCRQLTAAIEPVALQPRMNREQRRQHDLGDAAGKKVSAHPRQRQRAQECAVTLCRVFAS